MKFTVDRSKWRCGGDPTVDRGHGQGDTLLLNKKGYMCCLGFVGEQLGCPRDKLLNQGEPACTEFFEDVLGIRLDDYDFNDDGEPVFGWFNTTLSNEAMQINDDEGFSDQDREQRLIDLFKTYDHELVFVGEYECSAK